MNLKFTNRTDLIVFIVCITDLWLLSINLMFSSIILLYISGIFSFVLLIFWAIKKDSPGMLRRSLIIGGIGGFFYSFVDRLFVDNHIIMYLRTEDIHIYRTPLSVIFVIMYFCVIMLYFYQRLRSYFSKVYIPSFITGITALILSFTINYIGTHSRQWIWNAIGFPTTTFGQVPLFVPFAFFVTFSLSPYILGLKGIPAKDGQVTFWSRYFRASDNPIVGGVRCAIVLSASLFFLMQIFLRLTPIN